MHNLCVRKPVSVSVKLQNINESLGETNQQKDYLA